MRFDVLVVGSGMAGVMSAKPLVDAGHRVGMVDVGIAPSPSNPLFEQIGSYGELKDRQDQWRWLLGEDASAIPVDGMAAGPGGQLAGNRSFAVADSAALAPIKSANVTALQSFARGGFGSVWGGTCDFYTDRELSAAGLPIRPMRDCYQSVAKLIGLSGPAGPEAVQPALLLDGHASAVAQSYSRRRSELEKAGYSVRQPYTALLTEPLGSRQATSYSDLEYYSDWGRSIWRPGYLLDELEREPNFTYLPGHLVKSVDATTEGVACQGDRISDGSPFSLSASKVVMAAGAIGSARILLASLGLFDTPLPFLAKKQSLLVCLRPASLGDPGPDARVGVCQLLLEDETEIRGIPAATAQLYSYRALQLFRLLPGLPLPMPEGMDLLAALAPSLVIVDVRYPTFADHHSLSLRRDGVVEVRQLSGDRPGPARIRKLLRKLAVWPLKTVDLPAGSTIHYGGTTPISEADSAPPLSLDSAGRLRQMVNVYVADSSAFRCIPAKPAALTMMANAYRIGSIVAQGFN